MSEIEILFILSLNFKRRGQKLLVNMHTLKILIVLLPFWLMVVLAQRGRGSTRFKPQLIVGGHAVEPYSIPFQVYLEIDHQDPIDGERYVSVCGGSLLSSKYILSAAHCFDDGKLHAEVYYIEAINTLSNSCFVQSI